MTVISSNLQNLAPRSLATDPDLLARSLARLASLAPTGNSPASTDILVGADSSAVAAGSLQAASADVQTSLSSLQTAGGYLDGMSGLLSGLADLAKKAQAAGSSPADLAQYRQQFKAYQDQLRGIVGGTTAEIGGTTDVASPAGSFNGSALFGAGAAGAANSTGLRHGAMLTLIRQDAAGAFGLDPSDPGAAAAIADATSQVTAQQDANGAAQTSLQLAAANLQVGQQNLLSAFNPIADADAAQQSTQFAQYNILGQSAVALAAQSGAAPASVLNLVSL